MTGPSPRARAIQLVASAAQIALFAAAWWIAFGIRFDFDVPAAHHDLLWATLPVAAAVKSAWFVGLRMHRHWWRYASVRDLEVIGQMAGAATATLVILFFLIDPGDGLRVPRGVFLFDFVLSVFLLGGLRLAGRVSRGRLGGILAQRSRRRIVIFGAGDSAEQLLREIDRNPSTTQRVEALFDDDPAKVGQRVHGVQVVGPTASFVDFAATRGVDEVVIATPRATRAQMAAMIATCRDGKVPFRVLPAISDLLDGKVSWSKVRDVDIEDVLGRATVDFQSDAVRDLVQGRTVLISGGGGSIGSELVRQVARWAPRRILALDQAENPLFDLLESLKESGLEVEVRPIVADVCDADGVEGVFRDWRPQVVLHAAAHKHVPLMEENVLEAARNNVFGSRCLAEAAARHGAAHFVMISTDKAVNPTSVMGTTKRLAELVVQSCARRFPETRFVSVRFGNVLGSRGSVVPIFKRQIAAGGPVTVTHPDMMRYFMTIPEASQLVLEAGALGQGGEVFILDMGEPVRIVDMARELIRLSGFVPDEEIQIQFTGTRPGEKLFEELSLADEGAQKTHHPRVFVGHVRRLEEDVLTRGLDALAAAIRTRDGERALTLLGELVEEAQLTAKGRVGSTSRQLRVVDGGAS